jgi:hypothetical protein
VGLWLDPAEGMIGWPSFQTKDGKMYGRAWVAALRRGDAIAAERLRQATIANARAAVEQYHAFVI